MLNIIIKQIEDKNEGFFIHLIIIFIFTNLYYFLAPFSNKIDKQEFSQSWERTLYYSVITHFTIGFGDITPKSKLLRRLTICQVILAFLFFKL